MKFQKGDRVRVYATLNGIMAESSGEVIDHRSDGMLFVELDKDTRGIVAHPKQCRKLVPRNPLNTFWVSRGNLHAKDSHPYCVYQLYQANPDRFMQVREVRKKCKS